MYTQHFAFNKAPFSLIPDPDFFISLLPYTRLLSQTKKSLEHGEAFIKITGDKGCGKTLFCRRLVQELPNNYCCIYFSSVTARSVKNLCQYLASALGFRVEALYLPQLIVRIERQLLGLANNGYKILLIFDDAELLSKEVIELIRFFNNLETESDKLLQVILVAEKLINHQFRTFEYKSLVQRITSHHELSPLSYRESIDYILHRIRLVNDNNDQVNFNALLSDKIIFAAKGIPKIINILCHNALTNCYLDGASYVQLKHINYVAYRKLNIPFGLLMIMLLPTPIASIGRFLTQGTIMTEEQQGHSSSVNR